MLSTSSIATVALLATSALAADAVWELNLANGKNVGPDGIIRTGSTINGDIQGPLIFANKDDNMRIMLKNNNTVGAPFFHKSTSIHWHGLFQHRTAAEDGVAFVTQCPIAAGHSYEYAYPLNGQAGTFWYHSHLGTQYCDGLRGPLVVYDPEDPLAHMYDVDDEGTVITLADWYGATSLMEDPYTMPRPAEPIPISHLINGKGRRANTTMDLSVVSVEKGKKYRFRLINMSCRPRYTFWIEGHKLNVIEADGILHQPVEVDSLVILSGQRYSFVLDANKEIANYWIRIAPDQIPAFDNDINSGILRYLGALPEHPKSNNTLPTGVKPLKETDLVPLINPGGMDAKEEDVTRFFLNVTARPDTRVFEVNGQQFIPTALPTLLQILNGTVRAQDIVPKGAIYEVDRDKTIEITLPGGIPGSPHPIHLHGHTFDVVQSGSSNQTEMNFVNPPRRDVVSLAMTPEYNTTFRFRTDNPGPWILHCHIDWHLDGGFAVIFAERTPEAVNGTDAQIHSKAWDDLCPIYNSLSPADQ